MVSADPLGGPNLLLGRLDSSHFWHGIDASLADKWSTGLRPFLFHPLGDRLRPVGPVLLHLQCRVRLGCIVKQVTRLDCVSSIDQEERSSPSQPIRSGP